VDYLVCIPCGPRRDAFRSGCIAGRDFDPAAALSPREVLDAPRMPHEQEVGAKLHETSSRVVTSDRPRLVTALRAPCSAHLGGRERRRSALERRFDSEVTGCGAAYSAGSSLRTFLFRTGFTLRAIRPLLHRADGKAYVAAGSAEGAAIAGVCCGRSHRIRAVPRRSLSRAQTRGFASLGMTR